MSLVAPNCIIELWDNMKPEDFPQPFAIVMGAEILGFDSKEERAAAMSGGLVQAMIERNSRDWIVETVQ
jgi:hypothetical protein